VHGLRWLMHVDNGLALLRGLVAGLAVALGVLAWFGIQDADGDLHAARAAVTATSTVEADEEAAKRAGAAELRLGHWRLALALSCGMFVFAAFGFPRRRSAPGVPQGDR